MIKPLLLSLALITASCRVNHEASGEVATTGHQSIVVDVTIRIDISGCLQLPEEDRLSCVNAIAETLGEMTDVAKVLLCVRDLESTPIGEGADTPESCRGLASTEGGTGEP